MMPHRAGSPPRRAPLARIVVPPMATFAVRCGVLCIALIAGPGTSQAQGGLATEGALFLLVPVGARAVGLGQADVASDIGSEAIWANPAGLARLTTREFALHHSQNIVATGDALDIILPTGKAGVIAATAYLVNYGEQQATDQFGQTGTVYPRAIVLAASYAATFGSRVSVGVTYKFLQQRVDCSGSCGDVAAFSASSNAVDVGAQIMVDRARRLTVGFDIRDAGLTLQVNDAPQADPLPTRMHLGAQYLIPNVAANIPGGDLRVSAELVEDFALNAPALRAGVELAIRKQFFFRAGVGGSSGDGAGAAIGLGFRRGGISIDFARGFGGFSSDAGKPPTYLTLRVQF